MIWQARLLAPPEDGASGKPANNFQSSASCDGSSCPTTCLPMSSNDCALAFDVESICRDLHCTRRRDPPTFICAPDTSSIEVLVTFLWEIVRAGLLRWRNIILAARMPTRTRAATGADWFFSPPPPLRARFSPPPTPVRGQECLGRNRPALKSPANRGIEEGEGFIPAAREQY